VTPYSRPPFEIVNSERALALAHIQYRVGTVDLSAVEQSQLALHGARTLRLRVQSEQLVQRVNLYPALGGGFALPAMEPVAAQQ
jgi:outer membrane protein TolC